MFDKSSIRSRVSFAFKGREGYIDGAMERERDGGERGNRTFPHRLAQNLAGEYEYD